MSPLTIDIQQGDIRLLKPGHVSVCKEISFVVTAIVVIDPVIDT